MMRGSSALVMRPNVAGALKLVLGLFQRNQLKALNASTRASMRCVLAKRNERTSDRSTLRWPGPVNELRC